MTEQRPRPTIRERISAFRERLAENARTADHRAVVRAFETFNEYMMRKKRKVVARELSRG